MMMVTALRVLGVVDSIIGGVVVSQYSELISMYAIVLQYTIQYLQPILPTLLSTITHIYIH